MLLAQHEGNRKGGGIGAGLLGQEVCNGEALVVQPLRIGVALLDCMLDLLREWLPSNVLKDLGQLMVARMCPYTRTPVPDLARAAPPKMMRALPL